MIHAPGQNLPTWSDGDRWGSHRANYHHPIPLPAPRWPIPRRLLPLSFFRHHTHSCLHGPLQTTFSTQITMNSAHVSPRHGYVGVSRSFSVTHLYTRLPSKKKKTLYTRQIGLTKAILQAMKAKGETVKIEQSTRRAKYELKKTTVLVFTKNDRFQTL